MRILLVEDDKDLCNALSFNLKNEHYEVECCYNGEDALYLIFQQAHDLIILDRMLPSIDGLSILTSIRKANIFTPVLIITAMNQLGDKINGLDSGADDYLVKPFEVEELLARIRAISRRPKKWESTQFLKFSDIILDVEKQSLKNYKNSCSLSKRETQLMEFLIKNANQILPRNLIISRVWGTDTYIENGNLDNYIYFLRRRIKSIESHVQIKTIHSVGYLLEEKNA